MSDSTSDARRTVLAMLLPRRGIWRVFGGVLGLTQLAALPGDEAAAKKKKKKPVVSKCAGKVCNAGFACDESDGLCKCTSGVTCASGGVCCTASQVCDDAQACCSPQPQATTCQGKCGSVDNNCDQAVNCGNCAGGQVCLQNSCCVPEPAQQTCADMCGPVTNNCEQTVACGDCGDGFVCSDLLNGGVCACSEGLAACEGGEVCCAAGEVCAAATDTCSSPYQFVTQWGGLSECVQPDCDVPEFDGKFNKPSDLAFDADDNVYVVDSDNERVQKFSSGGAFLTKFGEPGFGTEQFSFPYGIEVAADGVVHVADLAHNRVRRPALDDEDEFLYEFAGNWGAFGADPGEFNQPLFIAQDSGGNHFVSDSFNHRVQKFTSAGVPILAFGEFGTANGKFNQPAGVAVDSNDDVFVVDYGNHRVQKFSSLGVHITTWGSFGDLPGRFVLPQGIAVDSFDDVYVADTNNHRIQKFTQGGVDPLQYTWVTQLGTTGSFGDDPSEFRAPFGVGLDSQDNLYVADTHNHRIQKFSPVEEAVPLRAGGGVGAEGKTRSSRRKRGRDRDRSRGNDRQGHRR